MAEKIKMSSKITKISARQILDSRGNPTVEVTVFTDTDFAIASVPSGASTGSHEAFELRDGGKSFGGKSVLKAINNIEKKILPKIRGKSIFDQQEIDDAMILLDGTSNKQRLGANAILAVSIAVARLGSQLKNQTLYSYLASSYDFPKPKSVPTPLFNVFNGGLHADSGTDVQEFFFIPKLGKFEKKVETAWMAINSLKKVLQKKNLSTAVGDEGGFASKTHSNEKTFRLLKLAIQESGLRLGKDIAMGIDAAATEFFDADKQVYNLRADRKTFKPSSIYRLYSRWSKNYHLEIIEDGCSEDDYLGWQKLTENLGPQFTLVGDDLFVTNQERLHNGIITGLANAVLIKPNQIGTVSETMDTIQLAKKFKYKVVISHRSGETSDDFIADLSAAVGADYIKAGSLARGERLAKYNRLLKIAEELKV